MNTERSQKPVPDLMTLSYRSQSLLDDPAPVLPSLIAQARAANLRLGVTGMLMFDGTHFMQTLEGPETETIELFLRILEDTRHTLITPFGIKRIEERRFPSWQMLQLDIEQSCTIAPDLDDFDFSERRLLEIHDAARDVALRC